MLNANVAFLIPSVRDRVELMRFNLRVLILALIGSGTPKALVEGHESPTFVRHSAHVAIANVIITEIDGATAMLPSRRHASSRLAGSDVVIATLARTSLAQEGRVSSNW